MSLIHYKFKAAKDFSSVTFEGLTISLFELKKEILLAKKLKGTDFDIVISNAQTNEEFTDDQTLIPKNTSVFVKRVPASGKYCAQYYLNSVSNAAPTTTATSSGGINLMPSGPNSVAGLFSQSSTSASGPTLSGGVLPGENEDEKIDAMMKQNFEQFDKQTDQMAANNPMSKRSQNYNNKFNHMRNNPQLANRPPPPNYVCFRCGERGHYITFCPTHGEKKFDQPKVKRTTGIPRSFLKAVEKPPEGKGVMITSDGDLVIAQANDTAWQQHRQRAVGNSTNIEDMRADIPAPIDLECKICHLLLKEPVSTPCCSSLFCIECITNELVNPEHGERFKCPQCQSTNIVPDSLVTEPEINQRVNQVTRDYISAKQKEAVELNAGQIDDENEFNQDGDISHSQDDQDSVGVENDSTNVNQDNEDNLSGEAQGNTNPRQPVKSFMSDIMAPNQHYVRPRPHPPNQFPSMMFPPPNMMNRPFPPPPPPMAFRPDNNPPPLRWTREGGFSDHKNGDQSKNEPSNEHGSQRHRNENGRNDRENDHNRPSSPHSRSRSSRYNDGSHKGRQDHVQSPRGVNPRNSRPDKASNDDRNQRSGRSHDTEYDRPKRSLSRESRRDRDMSSRKDHRSPSPRNPRRSDRKGDSYRPPSRSHSRDHRPSSRRGSGSDSDRLNRRRVDDHSREISFRGDSYRPERSRSPISKRLSGVRNDISDRLGDKGGRRRGMDSFRPDRDRPSRDVQDSRDPPKRRPIEERLEERVPSRRSRR